MQDALKAIGWCLGFRVQGLRRLHRDNGKMETTIICWAYIGILEKKMETTIVYWAYIGIMERKMESTVVFILGSRRPLRACVGSNLKGFKGLGFIV